MRAFAIAAVIVAAMLWGTTGTVQALLPADRDPLAVGALRLVIGALALVALALTRPNAKAAFASLPRRAVCFAGLAIGGYNLLFFHAVSAAGVGIGTAITIGSAPVFATAYEMVVLRRPPGWARGAGQVASIAGVALLALTGTAAPGAGIGTVLALGAGGCYAAYSLATSAGGGRVPPLMLAAATFSIAALAVSPVLIVAPLGWITPQSWMPLLFLGIAATALSYALYTWGLRVVAASTAVTLALAEPVTAWLLASLALGEPISPRTALGAGLILAGLAIVATARPERPT